MNTTLHFWSSNGKCCTSSVQYVLTTAGNIHRTCPLDETMANVFMKSWKLSSALEHHITCINHCQISSANFWLRPLFGVENPYMVNCIVWGYTIFTELKVYLTSFAMYVLYIFLIVTSVSKSHYKRDDNLFFTKFYISFQVWSRRTNEQMWWQKLWSVSDLYQTYMYFQTNCAITEHKKSVTEVKQDFALLVNKPSETNLNKTMCFTSWSLFPVSVCVSAICDK